MKNKKIVFGIVALVAVVALMAGAYLLWMPKGVEGAKQIEVAVVRAEGNSKQFSVRTDRLFLRGALEEIGLVGGEESQFGLFVKTVDGYTADDGKQEWWCFTKGGEQLFTGVDVTPVENGDRFEITLTVGY